jgi:hypothetical protein
MSKYKIEAKERDKYIERVAKSQLNGMPEGQPDG